MLSRLRLSARLRPGRNLFSGLLVLMLMLVWQALPGLRPLRGPAPQGAAAVRLLLPDAIKPLQQAVFAKAADDRIGGEPPFAAGRIAEPLPRAETWQAARWLTAARLFQTPALLRPFARAPPAPSAR